MNCGQTISFVSENESIIGKRRKNNKTNVSSSISRKKMKFFPKNHDFNFNHVIIEVITRCLRHHPNEGVPMAPERGSLWRYFKTITGLWQSTVV